ncbi:uncharacterized protein EDB91DRAFT_1126891 [Suillus paluster]|uniref:uncharacterized protein n=1 Tax=Suillus paluster TaxID=48578 RepID=UPI001B85EB33|nr:uncharacterized protein EDB91DRAFT_1126891 [Suillus paluster]KAG1743335.1 hypothetical protein EDB91DRAFT_1126891 [Suillus paluster]
MMCRPPGRCTIPSTQSVWPRVVWQGATIGVWLVVEDMVQLLGHVIREYLARICGLERVIVWQGMLLSSFFLFPISVHWGKVPYVRQY